jgi:tRNA-Thr(GGU) m(6)t(6)A37 methyltransferase TsaA
MSEKFEVQIIGHIYNDYNEKFGIPRQSGLVNTVMSKIILKKEFSQYEFFKGIENYTHIWLLWQFSETIGKEISPTVRPPKLGGNTRMGVFSTRSPFRPNHIGLSSVKIEKIEQDDIYGTVLYISGSDLMNGTPIIDIKPYLPYTDCHNDASNGFALCNTDGILQIEYSNDAINAVSNDKIQGLIDTLKHDPRPSYQNDENRIYAMSYGEYQVKFVVKNNILTIIETYKI